MTKVPHNIRAEQVIIGAILIDNEEFYKVSSFLMHHHFYDPVNRRIYETIAHIIDSRKLVADIVSLTSALSNYEEFMLVGGEQFLAQLTSYAMGNVFIEDYANIVYDAFLRRQLLDIGEQIVHRVYHLGVESPAISQIEQAEASLFNLATKGQADGAFVSLKDLSAKAIDKILKIYNKEFVDDSSVSSGFYALDNKLHGFFNSDLVILAGRPGMGKTALMINLATNVAQIFLDHKIDKSVCVFSLEMSSEQLISRIISMYSDVTSDKLRSGSFHTSQYNAILNATQKISAMPLYIDDTPGISIGAIRKKARKLHRQKKIGLIVIDYLQLIQGMQNQYDNRVAEVSEITKGIKNLARELDVPVIALSQLSRAVEHRTDKKPLLADLRESGSIEQDADVVMFIYRDDYYKSIGHQEAVDQPLQHQEYSKTEIIIAKHRHGATGVVELGYNLSCSKFQNIVYCEKQ